MAAGHLKKFFGMADHSNQRLKNLLNDIEAIKKACAKDKACPFQAFEYDNFVFKFEYHNKNEKRFYWINLTEDYPNSSSLTCTINGSVEHYTKRFDLPIPFEFCNLARELYKEIPIHAVSVHSALPTTSKGSAVCADDDDDDDDDDENSYCEDEFDDENYEMYDAYDEMFEKNSEVRQKINSDFDNLKTFCPDAEINEIRELDTVECLFPISTQSLEDELARAWKLKPKLPVFVKATFSLLHYTCDLNVVKVEVFQQSMDSDLSINSPKLVSPILLQLKSVVSNFIKGLDKETLSRCDFQIPVKRLKLRSDAKIACFSGDMSDSKKLPDLGCGFLVELMAYAQQRLHTLNKYCVICDELHVYANMLKPMVCARPLCVFSYQTMGVMSSVTDAISTEFEVIDLLIKMASAACMSPRNTLIFDPFPSIVNPRNSSKLAVSSTNRDFKLVQGIMKEFLPMEEMIAFNGMDLKASLDKKHELLYPLLQWIISSNRCHIVKLSQDKQLACMKTRHQFLLLSSAPEKEEAFREAKQKHGSIFAFHGSPIENWHSIMRKGLVDASGTKLQMNGSAFGKGIYLSPESMTSFSYSGIHVRKPSVNRAQVPKSKSLQFLPSQNILCIALCEVINSQCLKKCEHIWLMPNEDYVVTRFLFVYEGLNSIPIHVKSTDSVVLREVVNALKS